MTGCLPAPRPASHRKRTAEIAVIPAELQLVLLFQHYVPYPNLDADLQRTEVLGLALKTCYMPHPAPPPVCMKLSESSIQLFFAGSFA